MEGKGVNCWKLNGVIAKTKPKIPTETVDGKTPF
jgi:hypothetical protein